MIFNNYYRDKNAVRFIDTSNLITTSVDPNFEYTAKKDCWLFGVADKGTISIDGVVIMTGKKGEWSYICIPLKRGQVVKCTGDNDGSTTYKIFGVLR